MWFTLSNYETICTEIRTPSRLFQVSEPLMLTSVVTSCVVGSVTGVAHVVELSDPKGCHPGYEKYILFIAK